MVKRALIVDDSKTAQVRLRKMLEKFDIEIDTSNSAEEALGYLSYRQPAVIFLDHHMEGMSGLSALKIIKSNPATALIPVVMYTSEQGDVYVGQARALGALDIISKEVIQYSSIEKVLSSLGISAKDDAKSSTVSANTQETSSAKGSAFADISRDSGRSDSAAPYHASSDLNKVQSQVGKLFEIHIAKVRQEIEDNTKFLMRRLSKEIQERNVPKLGAQTATPEPAVSDDFQEHAADAKPQGLGPVWLVLIFLALVLIGYQLFANHQAQELSGERVTALAKNIESQTAQLEKRLADLAIAKAEPAGVEARVLLDALGWAVNINPQVPFNEKPLSDQRIYMLGELLALLKGANFRGTVFIDVHAGNYCVVKTPSGEWMLPDPAANLEDCVFLADQDAELTLNDQVSVGFLNYLHSTPVLTEGGISVELSSLGYDSPKFSYPPRTSAISAGDWNTAAAKNSRLSFAFSPD